MNVLNTVVCRLFGRGCSPKRPASKDIVSEMRERGRRAEAQGAEFRRARAQGIADAMYPPQRNGGRRP